MLCLARQFTTARSQRAEESQGARSETAALDQPAAHEAMCGTAWYLPRAHSADMQGRRSGADGTRGDQTQARRPAERWGPTLGHVRTARSAAAGRSGRLHAPARLPAGDDPPPTAMDRAGHRLAAYGPGLARTADPGRRQPLADSPAPAGGRLLVAVQRAHLLLGHRTALVDGG